MVLLGHNDLNIMYRVHKPMVITVSSDKLSICEWFSCTVMMTWKSFQIGIHVHQWLFKHEKANEEHWSHAELIKSTLYLTWGLWHFLWVLWMKMTLKWVHNLLYKTSVSFLSSWIAVQEDANCHSASWGAICAGEDSLTAEGVDI